jgi:hypothetical protein
MITGQDRNEPRAVYHWYDGNFDDPGNPLCIYGWNRGGDSYSIFRNNPSGSECKICAKRKAKGLKGVEPKRRETKWI